MRPGGGGLWGWWGRGVRELGRLRSSLTSSVPFPQCNQFFDLLQDLVDHVNDFHVKPEKDAGYCCHWEGCARHGRGFNARWVWGGGGQQAVLGLWGWMAVGDGRHRAAALGVPMGAAGGLWCRSRLPLMVLAQVQDADPHPDAHQREAAPLPHLQQELLSPGEPEDPQPLAHR